MGAEFERQLIIEQNHELGCFSEREATVFGERSAGASMIECGTAIEFHERLILGQRAHGPITLNNFWREWRLAGTNHRDSVTP